MPEDQAAQRQVLVLTGPRPVGEMDIGITMVGLLDEKVVDPGLHLRGNPGKWKSAARAGRTPRAAAEASDHHGIGSSSPEFGACEFGAFEFGGLGQHLGVKRHSLHQLLMRAVGDDLAAIDQHNPIRQADRRQPVSDDQCGPPDHEALQIVVDRLLYLDVDGAGGVVQDPGSGD